MKGGRAAAGGVGGTGGGVGGGKADGMEVVTPALGSKDKMLDQSITLLREGQGEERSNILLTILVFLMEGQAAQKLEVQKKEKETQELKLKLRFLLFESTIWRVWEENKRSRRLKWEL